MFKMEQTISDDGDIADAIFMPPDGMFEGRSYRKRKPTNGSKRAGFDVCVTGTLVQARILVHEELGCKLNECQCQFV